jgi:hypothetical protein
MAPSSNLLLPYVYPLSKTSQRHDDDRCLNEIAFEYSCRLALRGVEQVIQYIPTSRIQWPPDHQSTRDASMNTIYLKDMKVNEDTTHTDGCRGNPAVPVQEFFHSLVEFPPLGSLLNTKADIYLRQLFQRSTRSDAGTCWTGISSFIGQSKRQSTRHIEYSR